MHQGQLAAKDLWVTLDKWDNLALREQPGQQEIQDQLELMGRLDPRDLRVPLEVQEIMGFQDPQV